MIPRARVSFRRVTRGVCSHTARTLLGRLSTPRSLPREGWKGCLTLFFFFPPFPLALFISPPAVQHRSKPLALNPKPPPSPADHHHRLLHATPRDPKQKKPPETETESEFVAAFDSLLRNSRDQVPPQNLFERLTHILMRAREPITLSNRRDSVGGDATVAGLSAGDGSSIHDDNKLVRSTIDIFRRVHAQHPAAAISFSAPRVPPPAAADVPPRTPSRSWASSQPSSSSSSSATSATPYARISALTWTPLDSDKRSKGHHDESADSNASGGGGGRGVSADWHRFNALMQAAGGKPEALRQLCAGDGHGGGRRAAARGERVGGRRGAAEDDGADVGAGGSSGRRSTVGSGAKKTGSWGYEDSAPPPLGAALLFLHAVDVFVSDAACRLAVFQARTAAAPAASAAASAGTVNATPSSQVRDSPAMASPSRSPGVPESPQLDASQQQRFLNAGGGGGGGGGGAWAVGLLQNALLYRFVNHHIPTDSERASFFNELLDLAGAAAERSAALQPADALSSKMEPPPPLTPGAEDVAPDEIAGAAHRLLSRLTDLLDAMEGAYSGGGGVEIRHDRTLVVGATGDGTYTVSAYVVVVTPLWVLHRPRAHCFMYPRPVSPLSR